MLAGVPSRIASAASTSAGPADRAGRRTTSTPVISGSVAPRSTASNISAMAGDGVWCTISRVATAATLPPAGSRPVAIPAGFRLDRGTRRGGDGPHPAGRRIMEAWQRWRRPGRWSAGGAAPR